MRFSSFPGAAGSAMSWRLCDKEQFAEIVVCAMSRVFVPWAADWSTNDAMVLSRPTNGRVEIAGRKRFCEARPHAGWLTGCCGSNELGLRARRSWPQLLTQRKTRTADSCRTSHVSLAQYPLGRVQLRNGRAGAKKTPARRTDRCFGFGCAATRKSGCWIDGVNYFEPPDSISFDMTSSRLKLAAF